MDKKELIYQSLKDLTIDSEPERYFGPNKIFFHGIGRISEGIGFNSD